jgi:hypothetical protein
MQFKKMNIVMTIKKEVEVEVEVIKNVYLEVIFHVE